MSAIRAATKRIKKKSMRLFLMQVATISHYDRGIRRTSWNTKAFTFVKIVCKVIAKSNPQIADN